MLFRSCDRDSVLMVAGASNQWFPLTLSALALPKGQGGDIDKLLDDHWPELEKVEDRSELVFMARLPQFGFLKEYDADAVIAAVTARKQGASGPAPSAPDVQADLFRPEWEALSGPVPPPSDDFALRPVFMKSRSSCFFFCSSLFATYFFEIILSLILPTTTCSVFSNSSSSMGFNR